MCIPDVYNLVFLNQQNHRIKGIDLTPMPSNHVLDRDSSLKYRNGYDKKPIF